MKLLAYHKRLLKSANYDRDNLALRIYMDAQEQNPMAWELLEMNGDENYTPETFYKAADLILKEHELDRITIS